MKKLLVVLLTLALCVTTLASCDFLKELKDNFNDIRGNDEVTYNVNAAADYIFNLYQGKNITAADFELTAKVALFDDATAKTVSYDVTWALTGTDKLTLSKKDDLNYVVDVPDEPAEDIPYVLTATIKAADGTTATKTFNFTVPKYVLNTFEEYMAAKKGENVVVRGIVVAINSKSVGNKYNHLFLADLEGKGGYYCYSVAKDPISESKIEVGMTVEISGPIEPYSGMQEIKGGSVVKIVDSNKKEVAPLDLTDKFAAGESFANYVGMPATIKGVEIGAQDMSKDTSQYLYFKLNGRTAYVRTYVSDFPTTLKVNKDGETYTSPDKAPIDNAHKEKFGWKADVTGIVVLYNSEPYFIPMSVTPFTNFQENIKTPAEKVAAEKEILSVTETITENTTLTLDAVGKYYDDVTITWALGDKPVEGGKLDIILGEEKLELTLTATITCGEATDTKVFTIKVDAASKDLYVPSNVATPTAGVAYKFYLNQVTLGKTLYITGEVSGRYLATTDKADQAIDVYVEAAENGVKFYILVGEEKQYITVYNNADGKLSVKFDAAGTSVYTYDATTKAWATAFEGENYYLGTYKDFNTVSASKTSYISAENTGVSQFPAGFATLAPATYVPVAKTEPAANTAYKFSLVQVTLGKTLYITGEVSGRYLATTDKADQAIDVYAEAVEGGFKFYILVGEEKQYITVYNNADGKLSVKFDAAGTSVYTYDATTKAWATAFEGENYYLGTYKDFNTVSASKTSYISAENTGVSQFPAGLVSLELKEVAPVAKTEPAANTAYKFSLVQVTLGKTLYITGEVSGRYLATTDKISKAIDVYAEAVEGGFKFYILVGEEKQYITVYNNADGKLSVKFDAAGTSVYTYDATTKAWATAFEGENYYLGTYKDFNTVSASKTSYISAENTGVSQFPAGLVSIEVVSDTPDTPETPDTPDTPETPDEPEVTEPEGTTPVEPETPDEPTTEAKDTIGVTAASGTLAEDKLTITWESNNFTVISHKNSSNDIRTSDTDHFRCYANSKFEVVGKNNNTITKIVITCTESKYVTPLVNSATAAGYSVTSDGNVVTIEVNAAKVEYTHSAQVRIKNIEIYY